MEHIPGTLCRITRGLGLGIAAGIVRTESSNLTGRLTPLIGLSRLPRFLPATWRRPSSVLLLRTTKASTSSTMQTLASRKTSLAVRFGPCYEHAFSPTGESGSSRQVQFGLKLIF